MLISKVSNLVPMCNCIFPWHRSKYPCGRFLQIGLQSCAVILADSMSGLIKLNASCGSKRLILEMIRGVVHNTLFVILNFEMQNQEAVVPLFL